MRCSLKVISLGKMRGVENLSKTKKGLTAIGIIMIFGAAIPLLYPRIILLVAKLALRESPFHAFFSACEYDFWSSL